MEHLASDADRVPPDGEQSRPGPEPDPAAYSADGDGHASSDWERIYLATRPKRLAGVSGRQGAPKGLVNVVEQHARESAEQDELAWRRDLAAEARDRAAERRDLKMMERERRISRNASVRIALAHSADVRAEAAIDRARAADDRRQAAVDRLRAAKQRAEALRLLSSAQLDDLTGTYRRGIGERALEFEIERAERAGSQLVLAVLDVDGLKDVNDRQGHLAGDQLLCDVVASVQSQVRANEPIVRLGGDEFAFTIAGVDLDGAEVRIEKVREELSRRPSHGEFSVGLAEVRLGDRLADVIARADAALLAAR